MDPYTSQLEAGGHSFGGHRPNPTINDPFPMNDQRTIQQLAQEVLKIQDASNLPGVLYTWNESIRRLMRITTLSSDELHAHPINKLYAFKAAELSGYKMHGELVGDAFDEACSEIRELIRS